MLLSICVPTYNRPESIKIILEGFVNFQNDELEIIISDDNIISNENEVVVKNFNDKRIKYFRNEKNLNFGANMLKSIERSKGEFIYILMDDDNLVKESIPWILNVLKKYKNITHLTGSIGNNKNSEKKLYVENKDKYYKKGLESLNELLFHVIHASGIILKREALNLKKADKYLGFLYMQQALIAQALIAGDTLSTSRVLSKLGDIDYKSGQKLVQGRPYWHPLSHLYQIKYRFQIINDITSSMLNRSKIRIALNKKQIKIVYYELFSALKFSYKAFKQGIKIVKRTNEIPKTTFFWFNLIKYLLYHYVDTRIYEIYLHIFKKKGKN